MPGANAMTYRKTAVAQAEMVDGNLVVMNTATMKCFLMNDLAAVLWDAMDHYPEHDDLVSLLRQADNAAPEAALDALTTQLLDFGLIDAGPG